MWSIAERFDVRLRLGAGGMGKVYLCRDRKAPDEGLVAVKVLREQADGGDAHIDAHIDARIREFKILRHFEHPNIVRVLDAGTFKHAGRHRFWFSMEWIQGNNLFDYEWEDFPELGLVAAQVLSGLAALHDAGLVHGDVKPQNILVTREWISDPSRPGWRGLGHPVPKILDFGVASKARAREVFAGTPSYMAPEAIPRPGTESAMAQIGPPADIYCFGCVLYHVIARRLPYTGSDAEMQRKHADPGEWPPALPQRTPEYLRRLIERSMAKEPSARPQSATEILAVLRENGVEDLRQGSHDSLAAFGMALHFVDPYGRAAALAVRICGSLKAREPRRVFVAHATDGAGRTRFLREVKRHLTESGVLVVRTNGMDEGLHKIVSKLADACGSEMERQLFWRRHPHLTSGRPLAELPFDAIAESLSSALRATAARRLLVVAIDDAHYADRDVLHVLLRAMSGLGDSPVALLLLGNPDAAPADVREALGELSSAGVDVEAPEPFDHRCVEDYLRVVFRAEPEAQLVQYVLDASHGLPGAVATVVRHLHQSNDLAIGRDDRVIALRRALPAGSSGPVVSTAGLSDAEMDVLEVLACLRDVPQEGRVGVDIPPADVMRLVAGPAASSVDGALQALVSRGLAQRTSGGGRYRIASAARDSVLRGMPPARRRAVHGAIAELLDAAEEPLQRARRARRLWSAGDIAATSVVALGAGKQLMERWRLTEAIEMADLAIRCGESPDAVSPAPSASLYEALILKGDGLRLRARHAAAADCYRRASEVVGEPLMKARALVRVGDVLTSLNAREAETVLEEALCIVTGETDRAEQRLVLDEILVAKARLLTRAERRLEAIPVLERLLDVRRQVTPARVDAVLVDLARSRALGRAEDIEPAVRELEELLARAGERGDIETSARAHEALGNVLVIPDRLTEARTHINKALEIQTRLGNERARAAALGNLVHLTSHAGPFDVAERIARELFDWHGGSTANDTTLKALICLARVQLFEGQYLAALASAREAAAAIDQKGLPYLNEARVIEGQVLAELRAPGAMEAFQAERTMAAGFDATHVPAWVHEAEARVDWQRGRQAADDSMVEIGERALACAEAHGQVIYGALAVGRRGPQGGSATGPGPALHPTLHRILARRGTVAIGPGATRFRPHEARRWLNTLIEEGGVSDTIQALFFGRRDVRQNASYHCGTAAVHLQGFKELLRAKGSMWERKEELNRGMREGLVAGKMVEVYRKLTDPAERERFFDGQVDTVHYTPFGISVHHYSTAPCDRWAQCLTGCLNYLRTVGDQEERKVIQMIAGDAEVELARAKSAAERGDYGARNWVAWHQKLLDGCRAALAVDDDTTPPCGTQARVFPDGEPRALPLR